MEQYASLRANVGLLGRHLGETMQAHLGDELLEKVEHIRALSKSSLKGNQQDAATLKQTLNQLEGEELISVARAFNHFLSLANLAEQYHSVSPEAKAVMAHPEPFTELVTKLKQSDVSPAKIEAAIQQISIELVLTAHPTEATRRTLINKHARIARCLAKLENSCISKEEKRRVELRLAELIAQVWHTSEIRPQRPTPVDEAKSGFAMVEHSLWKAVPQYMRELEALLQSELGMTLPLDSNMVRFSSWMGGDRDGNPFVTANVTQEVLLLSRWKAVDLYLQDVDQLVSELSMNHCSEAFRAMVGEVSEPYRVVLKQLRSDLTETRKSITAQLDGAVASQAQDKIRLQAQVLTPLQACYDSLCECGMQVIANGALKDVIRRVYSFGVYLNRLDIRQDSERHANVFSELTRYLGLGDYAQWDEAAKQAFLLQELANKRPLFPRCWEPSAEVKEVLDTCDVIAAQPQEALGSYVISMATAPSDVLAVHLLLQDAGIRHSMPVVPLFETLDDLNGARDCIAKLFGIDWYRGYIKGYQQVMIGYSDSAKDAGVMAAGWAQYRAMEQLVKLADDSDIHLTLFHGRGGTIGRGGGPAHSALLSQPPGSLKGGLRLTEQGETIRAKYGLPQVAVESLAIYGSAILEALLLPPPAPQDAWRELMDQLAADSCDAYRAVVREEPDFVGYFRAATPELELAKLPLGSRPSKRKPGGGVETLRAIPWIFAWSQNRLMLPAWLGAGQALQNAIDANHKAMLKEMAHHWPFFETRLALLEMVFQKADPSISTYYDEHLVEPTLRHLGDKMRAQLANDIDTVLSLTEESSLMDNDPWNRESINLRRPYMRPLHMLQAELLNRGRKLEAPCQELDQALMITMAGIAAGMRNTG